RKHSRRKTKNSVGGVRLRKESAAAPSVRRGTRPETPFIGWMTDERARKDADSVDEKASTAAGSCRRSKSTVSARKIAADIWRLRSPEIQVEFAFLSIILLHRTESHQCSSVTDLINSPHSVSGPKHGILSKVSIEFRPIDAFFFLLNIFLHDVLLLQDVMNSGMEGATKWDPDGWKVSKLIKKPVDRHHHHHHHHHHHQSSSASAVVSGLEAELDQAKSRIHELETERRSSKKKLEQFLQKLHDEKAAWRAREHDKVRVIIEDVKADLTREKKNRQRLEMINSKLSNELSDLKLSAKRYVQEYEKERKARELIEEVCDELAKEIGEDKAEVEALKRDSINAREEVEEERKMLQMAEVWREERVQMKLVDAKVMLEEKYAQMNKLVADLETFLRSTSHMVEYSGENKKAQFLRQVAASVSMQDVRDLKYEPPNPNEIFSVFEDADNGKVHHGRGDGEDEDEPSVGYSPARSHASKNHAASPEVVKRDNVPRRRHSMDQNGAAIVEDDTSEWETVSQPEDQGSIFSAYGSDPSVRFSRSRVGESETRMIMEINEDDGRHHHHHHHHAGRRQPDNNSNKKGRISVSKLWKSCPINGDSYKIASVDGTLSAAKGGFSPNDVTGEWSSPESNNPHLDHHHHHHHRAKGCIEWPRNVQKGSSSLKSRLMEARMMDNGNQQKVQLRQVLKQKM
ncbi:hypothetical protein M569_16519, partial [Genlisea aurea]